LQAAKAFEAGVEAMPELEVVGSPEMCNIAFKSRAKAVDVYKVRTSRMAYPCSAVGRSPNVPLSADPRVG
jgi:glutamate/tyrosine decarboxylase-like PLP-dependent enzyme